MSLKRIVFVISAYFLCIISVKAQTMESFIKDYDKTDMYKIKKAHEQTWKDVPLNQQKGWKQYKRWEYFWAQRLFPNATQKQAIQIYTDIDRQIKDKKFETTQGNTWNLIGPFKKPDSYAIPSSGVGRVNIARFHPTDPNTIWIGTATGGVWKTNDKGKTWENFSFTQFLSLGVSDIAISPTNPDTVYVATGDADGSLGTANFFSSIGIIKTTNGGQTWEVTGMSHELSDNIIISRLIVNPENSAIVLAATNRGIYKTLDGGQTWEVKISGNFRDLELKYNSSNFLYAATGLIGSKYNYIYTTNDFGDTWDLKHTEGMAGRIQMAVSKSDPDLMVAICSQYQHSGLASIIATYDSGKTFETLIDSSYGNLLNWAGRNLSDKQHGQSYYDLCIAISPINPGVVIIGGIECHKTVDGGYVWRQCTNTTDANDVHVDMHDLVFNPLNNELYLCNDGGIYVSKDAGTTWTDISDGLSITQYYRVGMSATNPNLIVCGAQDNGTSMYSDGNWFTLYGGDGMDCSIDQTEDNRMYYSYQYGYFVKTNNKGKTSQILINPEILKSSVYKAEETGDWIAPFAISPQNPSTLYACYNNVWKSTNYGTNWAPISSFNSAPITAFTPAPSNSNYLYVVIRNSLYMTSDGGQNWVLLKLESNTITSVCVSPTDPKKIWYSVSGYNPNKKVIMYDGTTFTNLSGNLPNIPINTIVYQKNTNDRIYIGTDIGVFYSEGQSNIWDNINSNLPNLIISELEIFYGSGIPKLRAATYGRGVWETDVILCDNKALNISPTSEISICPHEFAELTTDGDYSDYTWNDGTKGKKLITNVGGEYSVSAMDGDCKVRSKTVNVTVISTSNIEANIKGNAPACIGDTIELFATAGFQEYLWSTGESGRTIRVNQTGKYYVEGAKTNAECRSYSDTLQIEFIPKPNKPTVVNHGSRLVAPEDSTLTYQWYIGNTQIKGAKSRIYQPDSSGNYRVLITNKGGCSTYSDEIYSEYTSVSNPEILDNIIISPNPSNGEFKLNIKSQLNDLIEYTITNNLGQTILSKSIRSNTEQFEAILDLENQADGVYMIIIKINGDSKTVKLIKK